MNNLHPKLEFTPTPEENTTINFLDLRITRQPSSINIDIYRKPTATDTTISYTSNHPMEHKLAAYRYMINQMTSIPLSQEKANAEWQTILAIANNNNFPILVVTKLITKLHSTSKITDDNKKKKWATFTYHSANMIKITDLFKQTNKHKNSPPKHQHNTSKDENKKPPPHP
jgi:hypothetical protein